MSIIDIEQYAHNGGIKALRVKVTSPAHKRALSIIEGARVHETDVTFAPDPFLVPRIKRLLQDNITLTDQTAAWLQQERERRESGIQLGQQKDALLTIPHAQQLRPYQRVGAAWLIERQRAILGDSMGLGKTIQALLAARAKGAQSILVVTLSMAKKQWQEEMKRWIDVDAVVIDGTTESRIKLLKQASPYTIIHYDLLRDSIDTPAKKKNGTRVPGKKALYSYLLARKYDVIIFDESQKLQNADAQQSRAARKLASRGNAVFQLTGTPLWSMPDSCWHLLHICDPHRFSSYWTFVERYCTLQYTNYGMKVVGLSEAHLPELRQVLASYILRRTKEEVLPDLPPKQHITLSYDLSPEQRRVYDSVERDLCLPTTPPKYYTNAAASLTDLRFLCSTPSLLGLPFDSPKDTLLLETLEKLFAEKDRKVIVFCWHKRRVAYLHALLTRNHYRVLTATGDDTGQDRANIVSEQFRYTDTQILVGTISAIGTALNIGFADTGIIDEHSWTPAENEQCYDRLHRMTTTHQVTLYHLVATYGIEQHIINVSDKKAGLANEMLAIRAVLEEMQNSREKDLTKEKP